MVSTSMRDDTASGKRSNDLEAYAVCKMAESCQKTRYSSHEDECKNRAYEQLPKQDCLICFLPMPLRSNEWQYQACCGKLCCSGCAYAIAAKLCPFCRAPYSTSDKESIKRYRKRIKFMDPNALWTIGRAYYNGNKYGLPLDRKKGFRLLLKAAELGSARAHSTIGQYYYYGLGVDVDMDKAKYHYEMAAVGGNVIAMYNLGAFEYNAGNHARAKKHWMVAASAGYDCALNQIRKGFMGGSVSKDELEKALLAHKDSVDETRSDQRDAAKAYMNRKRNKRVSMNE